MVLLDVNVLLGAQRKEDPVHASCLKLLALLEAKGVRCLIPMTVAASYLRISTNRKITSSAASLEESLAFLNELLSKPNFVLSGLDQQHWTRFTNLIQAVGATGNHVPDAQLAALAIEANATLISQDNDFARFSQLRWWRVDEALTKLQAAN